MSIHSDLVEAAENAVNDIHGDTSVSQQETIDSLRQIAEQATMLADVVESEMGEDDGDDEDNE